MTMLCPRTWVSGAYASALATNYLRLWFLLQHPRAINLLLALRVPRYYRELLPSEVRLMLPA